MSVVTVVVSGFERTYPEMIAEYGDFIAEGGRVESAHTFIVRAKAVIRMSDWVTSVTGWVTMDDSGCAYRIDVRASGAYTITGAAPMVKRQERYYA